MALARRLNASTSLLLLCDIQERFRDRVHAFASVVHVARALLDASRVLSVPYLATEQYPEKLGRTVPELRRSSSSNRAAAADAVAAATASGNNDNNNNDEDDDEDDEWHATSKRQFSMLTADAVLPRLERERTANGRTQCVVAGIEAHVCVLQTAMELIERGYEVHLVADGVSSQRQLDRSVGLRRAMQAGAFVDCTEGVIFQWMRSSQHPHFKALSAICQRARPHAGMDAV